MGRKNLLLLEFHEFRDYHGLPTVHAVLLYQVSQKLLLHLMVRVCQKHHRYLVARLDPLGPGGPAKTWDPGGPGGPTIVGEGEIVLLVVIVVSVSAIVQKLFCCRHLVF